MILNVSDGEVQGVEIVLAGGNGNRSFVGSQDDRDKHGTMSRWVPSDGVLNGGVHNAVRNNKHGKRTDCRHAQSPDII